MLDRPATTVAEFIKDAAEYKKEQLSRVGNLRRLSPDPSAPPPLDDPDFLAGVYWRNLSPAMNPPSYGADQSGSLYPPSDPASGWSVRELDSPLQLLRAGPEIPGVTSPYLYYGMFGATFASHTEDADLLSINTLHAGAPKYVRAQRGASAMRSEVAEDDHLRQKRAAGGASAMRSEDAEEDRLRQERAAGGARAMRSEDAEEDHLRQKQVAG
jgi:hypothetical protein